MAKGYRGFESKAAYDAHYSAVKNYADEIPAMDAYTRECLAEQAPVSRERAMPWHASRKGCFINDLNNRAIAEMCDSPSKQADAEFIAQAVNSYARMVDALEAARSHLNLMGGRNGDRVQEFVLSKIEVALTLALTSNKLGGE